MVYPSVRPKTRAWGSYAILIRKIPWFIQRETERASRWLLRDIHKIKTIVYVGAIT
jgi:hypothetical protein